MAKLLLITPDYPPKRGGVARYLSAMAKYFGDHMTVETQGLLYKSFWPKWLATTALLRKRKDTYDFVVTSHVIPFGTASMIAKWFTHKPYIVIVHGMDIRLARKSFWRRFLAGRVLKSAYVIIANSNALAQELSVFGIHQALVVYPCLDGIVPPESMPVAKGAKRLLTVSRLVPRKGHMRVLTALAELRQIGRLQHVEYHIVGSGPHEAQIKSLIHSLNLSSVVTLHGELDDEALEEQYALADVFVMPVANDPVDKEGFGLVYLEAALNGVPSIATNMSGVDEAVIDQETGVLINDNDIQALASWIDKLLNDDELRAQMGQRAKERASKEFTCQSQFSKIDPYL